ncbi:MAG: GHKL domain-containing protein, partial [Syntrophomonadaceae bacterium]|nr:GHKL domain-containing protein [Syntrophomonadaceae bacterium]
LDQQTKELVELHGQRHDLLNELTLALMYMQSGDMEKGEQCLRYAASHVSNTVSEQGLPEDAWMAMVNLKQKEAVARGITFHVHLSYATLEDPAESHLLARLLGNLLDNALEAAADSSKPFVAVACRHGEGYRKLVIGNNGATISPELIQQVRQPGFSTKGGNRGYGLAICQSLAYQMGGYLEIKSNPRTEWTEVSIVMPNPDKATFAPKEG